MTCTFSTAAADPVGHERLPSVLPGERVEGKSERKYEFHRQGRGSEQMASKTMIFWVPIKVPGCESMSTVLVHLARVTAGVVENTIALSCHSTSVVLRFANTLGLLTLLMKFV